MTTYENILNLVNSAEEKLEKIYKEVSLIENFNSKKVLDAFTANNINTACFNTSTGYGYDDYGRDKIENVYKTIFKSEDALVRSQFISGTHALTVALFALLRPDDTMLSITGKPYDTLDKVIGITPNDSSLMSYNIKYKQIDLINNDFDYKKIKQTITKEKIKLIEIQRSKGYSTRKSIDIDKLENVIKFIKEIDKDIIIMIDNCYCEFVSTKEPIEVGADIAVGSLIKNLGGGIAPNGGYIVGKSNLVHLCSERLNVPGEAKEVGPSLGNNKKILLGLFLAPSVVASALKTAILTSYLLQDLGYDVEPKYNERRADIVQNIIFNDKDKLIKYCKAIQSASPIDSKVIPYPGDMPGYNDKVIMAAGTFTQGSSIELSADGPIREPYIVYQQGSLTYSYGRISLMYAISSIIK